MRNYFLATSLKTLAFVSPCPAAQQPFKYTPLVTFRLTGLWLPIQRCNATCAEWMQECVFNGTSETLGVAYLTVATSLPQVRGSAWGDIHFLALNPLVYRFVKPFIH